MDAGEIRSRYWLPLAARHTGSSWRTLESAYGDSKRFYHSWGHVSDLLEALDQCSGLSTRPDLIATAIFWHDAVYATRSADRARRADSQNVYDSASMFRAHALMNAADAEAVRELILATADHLGAEASRERYPGFSADLDLFIDLDLSPLAAPWETFAANFKAIRQEFGWVSEPVFNAGQGAFLGSLLDNADKLFRRPESVKKWRGKAIANITRCLDRLQTGGAIDRKSETAKHASPY